jgi:tetratricopeptide (TPR) repeat protein
MKRNSQFKYAFLFLLCMITSLPALSVSSENTGSTGSITITRHVNAASKAFEAKDYNKARDEYRIAIGLSPETLEFYYGLYDVCVHSGEWDQVVYALEKIFEIDPSKKSPLLAQYGEALFHLNQYDKAIPVLKQALKEADLPAPKISLVVPAPVPEPEEDPSTKGPGGAASEIPNTMVRTSSGNLASTGQIPQHATLLAKDTTGFKLSFLNASHSECILIAEYLDYEHSPDIQFFHPPIAKYHISKILKGPPLNKDLPVRYEFYDRQSSSGPPPGWKFGKDKMPEKGSEWIIFIRMAVPRDGAFDTYEGSYGRHPATEENLNQIYALLENSANR